MLFTELHRKFWLTYLLICLNTISQTVVGVDLSQILYDDSYITNNLDERYPYLKLDNGSYLAPRDYFNFSDVFKPTFDYMNHRVANIEEYLFNELRAMEFSASIATMDQWHYSDEKQLLDSGKPDADEQLCAQDLDYIDRKLKSIENNTDALFTRGIGNINLLRYMDSWGRPPSETYHGNSYWVGSYRACKMATLQGEREETPMEFRYCWAKLRVKSWPEFDEMVPPTSFRVGLCLPKTCDTKMANQHNETIHRIMKFNFSPIQKDRFNRLINIYCLPTNQQNELPPRAKVFLTIIGSWLTFLIALSLLATAPKISRSMSGSLKSITIQESYKRFIADDAPKVSSSNQDNGRVDLRALNIVRLFGSIAVCIAHTGCSFGWVFYSSTFSLLEYRKLTYHMMPSLLKSLDLFMVIGGSLTAYSIAKKFPAKSIGSIIKFKNYISLWVIRYLRLAPMIILVLYFMKALYPSLSEGPMWDYGTYKFSMQGQCQRSDWLRLLVFPILFGYRGNYYLSECLPVSWYIVSDLKLAFVAPFLIYLFQKSKPLAKWLILGSVVLLSSFWQYYSYSAQRLIYFQQFFTYGQLFGVNILNLNFGETGYFNPINRMYAFAIGIFAGTYLYNYQLRKQVSGGKENKWPFWMTGFCFWSMVLFEIYDFFSPHIAQYNYLTYNIIPSEETIKLAMLIKPRIDAIIFAIIILRLASDLAPKLMQNTMPLYKLSKLSYCVFSIHAIVISYVVSANEFSRPNSQLSQFIMLTVFVITMSFIISFPLHLMFEAPFAQILSNLVANKRQVADKHQASSSSPSEVATITEKKSPGGLDSVSDKKLD